MDFPTSITPDTNTRAGRMIEQGDVRITVTSLETGRHITIRFKAFADNRDRQYSEKSQNWVRCPLTHATHVFVEVPGASGDFADKVGTFYPRGGRWFQDRNADPQRVWAAAAALHWINGNWEGDVTRFQEESHCGVCAKTLTDPVSIDRGIGPECYGRLTGSQHQVKEAPAQADVTPQVDEVAQARTAREQSKVLPGVFDEMSDVELESVIACAQRILEKRAFAKREREQENAAYQAKMDRDREFLSR